MHPNPNTPTPPPGGRRGREGEGGNKERGGTPPMVLWHAYTPPLTCPVRGVCARVRGGADDDNTIAKRWVGPIDIIRYDTIRHGIRAVLKKFQCYVVVFCPARFRWYIQVQAQ